MELKIRQSSSQPYEFNETDDLPVLTRCLQAIVLHSFRCLALNGVTDSMCIEPVVTLADEVIIVYTVDIVLICWINMGRSTSNACNAWTIMIGGVISSVLRYIKRITTTT